MNNIEIKLRELVKPKEINKIKSDVKTFELTEEKRYTYLNCIYRTNPMYVSDWWVNMHKTAFLKNKENGDTIYLIDAINIPFAPARHYLQRKGDSLNFVLIFPHIPKHWQTFDFIEGYSGSSLSSIGITRNETGVYQITVN